MSLPQPDLFADWKPWARLVVDELRREAQTKEQPDLELFSDVGYNSDWSDFGFGFQSPRFALFPNGLVLLEGVAAKATSAGSSSLVVTLPTRVRPANDLMFPQAYVDASVGSPAVARVDIQTDGDVVVNPSTTGAVSWLTLGGISYFLR